VADFPAVKGFDDPQHVEAVAQEAQIRRIAGGGAEKGVESESLPSSPVKDEQLTVVKLYKSFSQLKKSVDFVDGLSPSVNDHASISNSLLQQKFLQDRPESESPVDPTEGHLKGHSFRHIWPIGK